MRKYLGLLAWEGSADQWWRLTSGGAVQVYGCSTSRRYGGGEAGAKRERSGFDG